MRFHRISAVQTVLLAFATATSPLHAASRIESYANPSIYPASKTFSLAVNGSSIPVTDFEVGNDTAVEYSFAHFSFSGPITLSVTAPEDITTSSISPLAFAIHGTVDRHSLAFSLAQSRYLIIKINDLQELVIAADALDSDIPDLHAKTTYNILKFGADPTCVKPSTAAIQHAIDTATKKGGVVYVPPGLYAIASLTLRSHVTLYLDGGAVLRALSNPSLYAVTFHKASLKMKGSWLIQAEAGAHDFAIRGRGVIDGNGAALRDSGNFLLDLIEPVNVKSFTVDGIVGRDAGMWSVAPTRASNVVIRNYKGLQSLTHFEDDAIDINESQDVTIDHVLAISEDDTFSTKTWEPSTDIATNWTGSPQVVRHVVASDLLAWTHCAAFKIGNGHLQAQSDIVFRNSYVYNSSRAIAVDPLFGTAPVEDVVFENIDIEGVTFKRDGPYWLKIVSAERGAGAGPVRNITLRNINVRQAGARQPRILGFDAKADIRGVLFDNVVVEGKALRNMADLNATTNQFVSDIHFSSAAEGK